MIILSSRVWLSITVAIPAVFFGLVNSFPSTWSSGYLSSHSFELGRSRRLALGDSTQGCTQTSNSLPALSGVAGAVSWETSRCGDWFIAGDRRRYQACYLGCAIGTYADASTEYSNSSFWCARTELDKPVFCDEPSTLGEKRYLCR